MANSNSGGITVEDLDRDTFTYIEVKALASGNPLILEKFKVENELKQLYLSKSRYDKSHIELESKYNTEIPRQLKYQKEYLNGLLKDSKNVQDLSGNKFMIIIKNEIYSSRKFDVIGTKDELWYKPVIYVEGNGKYKVEISNLDEIGNIYKLENILKSFDNKINIVKEQIAYNEKQLMDIK